MPWIVLLIMALATAYAFDWIVVRTSRERITINVELIRIVPAIRRVRQCALALVRRESDLEDPQSHH